MLIEHAIPLHAIVCALASYLQLDSFSNSHIFTSASCAVMEVSCDVSAMVRSCLRASPAAGSFLARRRDSAWWGGHQTAGPTGTPLPGLAGFPSSRPERWVGGRACSGDQLQTLCIEQLVTVYIIYQLLGAGAWGGELAGACMHAIAVTHLHIVRACSNKYYSRS